MHSDYIETLQTALTHWSTVFAQNKQSSIDKAEYKYFKSVLEEMLVSLPCARLLWSLRRVFEIISLYFLFQEVKALETFDPSTPPENKALFELLQYGAMSFEDGQEQFVWLAEVVGKFSPQLTQDFLVLVETMPEYFNGSPVYTINTH